MNVCAFIFCANVANKTHVFCRKYAISSCCVNIIPLIVVLVNCRLALRLIIAIDRCSTERRLADEDDELSEVQPDAVPPEVREWLASTFTRQLVTTRKRTEEKPKFRTVAHAIRAGIFVDRIYRRVSSTAMLQFPPEVVKVLKVNNIEANESIFFYPLKRFRAHKTIIIINHNSGDKI